MKKSYQSSLILIILITILTLYIINSSLITEGILDYTKLFITKLFPTSFLLFTFSSLLINYQLIDTIAKITKKNSSTLYITIMSLISGFPSGTKYTVELFNKNYINQKTANYLLTYTHFPNPLFILGPVNVLIGNTKTTIKLLFSLLISNFLIALFLYKKSPQTPLPKTEQASFPKALNEAIISTTKTLILIYGTSLFFYLISLIIIHYISLTPITYILINGIFDLTKGIFSTSIISSVIIKAILIIIFISFGSISIHIQIKSILADTSLNYKNFLLGRIFSTLISLTLFFLFMII